MATQKEIVESITEILNPKTGQPFTVFDAERVLRADFKRRLKMARNMQEYRRRKNGD